ncbi:hypothetical protein OSB04_015680 [Centaurea solstitialis]|uniref:non-specific serine/threonine protein kinase n=1 Tax=Centaurea solstitialis TaxID=347529 RepID=A0AA38TBG8_9ASTR|nr:hypothetical protein OSB04_015680 [Centaurea solstitialis]
MPASEGDTAIAAKDKSSSVKKRVAIIVPIVSVLLVILLSACVFYRIKRRKANQEGTLEGDYGNNKNSKDDLELPLIDFSTLRKATNNFSVNNKLGQGGFGPVYKGVLGNGQEVAVKHGAQSNILDWPTRFHIIKRIARGLLYLHQDSRLRIIHRDLKVSSILLDHDMIPKISDFGLAKSFGGNQIEANTNRVVGTYGYMAPEYAGHGIFSIKSDVFSFGVLVLEIVYSKKNKESVHKGHSHSLLRHARELHKEGRSLELLAASLDESVFYQK